MTTATQAEKVIHVVPCANCNDITPINKTQLVSDGRNCKVVCIECAEILTQRYDYAPVIGRSLNHDNTRN